MAGVSSCARPTAPWPTHALPHCQARSAGAPSARPLPSPALLRFLLQQVIHLDSTWNLPWLSPALPMGTRAGAARPSRPVPARPRSATLHTCRPSASVHARPNSARALRPQAQSKASVASARSSLLTALDTRSGWERGIAREPPCSLAGGDCARDRGGNSGGLARGQNLHSHQVHGGTSTRLVLPQPPACNCPPPRDRASCCEQLACGTCG